MLRFVLSIMAVFSCVCAQGVSENAYSAIVVPDRVYSYDRMVDDLEKLKSRYSLIMTGGHIGTSVEGRKIPAVRLGRGSHKILVCAALHAREHITTNYLMYFLEKYAEAYASHKAVGDFDVQRLLDNASFYVVPMVNPDGVNIVQCGMEASAHCDTLRQMCFRNYEEPVHRSWKANANGVDINRNFDFGWENCLTDSLPASSGFKGFRPLSEPESKALADFAKRIKPEAVVAMHTQGEMLYLSTPDDKAKRIADRVIRSTKFAPQPIDEPYGSFQDFVDHHFGVFYACVELCPYIGPRPFDESRFYEIWEPAQYVLPIVADTLIGDDAHSDKKVGKDLRNAL